MVIHLKSSFCEIHNLSVTTVPKMEIPNIENIHLGTAVESVNKLHLPNTLPMIINRKMAAKVHFQTLCLKFIIVLYSKKSDLE